MNNRALTRQDAGAFTVNFRFTELNVEEVDLVVAPAHSAPVVDHQTAVDDHAAGALDRHRPDVDPDLPVRRKCSQRRQHRVRVFGRGRRVQPRTVGFQPAAIFRQKKDARPGMNRRFRQREDLGRRACEIGHRPCLKTGKLKQSGHQNFI